MKHNNKKQIAQLIVVCGVVVLTIITVICVVAAVCRNIDSNNAQKTSDRVQSSEKSSEKSSETVSTTQPATQITTQTPTQPSTAAPTQPPTQPTTPPQTPSAGNSSKKVYLTFDDGPSANTDVILDTLKKYDVKATFFVALPTGGEATIARYKRMIAEGHTLAIHTYTHDYNKVYASLGSFADDVIKMRDFIYDNTGYMPKFYRFPGGSSNSYLGVNGRVSVAACKEWLAGNNLSYFDWNVSSGDANSGVVEIDYILYNVLEGPYRVGIKDTSVVLMHDSETKATTAQAVDIIVSRLLAENYQILPITEDTVPVRHR